MVPLPCAEAREQMLRKNLAGRASEELVYSEVHDVTYSSDEESTASSDRKITFPSLLPLINVFFPGICPTCGHCFVLLTTISF